MQILVTGGAGYIGSHTAKMLARAGYEPVTVDNLCSGHRWAVRWGPLVEADFGDAAALDCVFSAFRIQAVLHFAAFAYVDESMREPAAYFRNNVANTLTLLDAMRRHGVGTLVFSSSCATYGLPRASLTEDHPQAPINPYGDSKLMAETLLRWYGESYGLRWAALRFFNAAGADCDGDLGEAHFPEPHLIPRAIMAARGLLEDIQIFGADYDTADGTAVRDYIHVSDLADAHVKSLRYLFAGGKSGPFNLGTGRGHSVGEVIAKIQEIAARKTEVRKLPRRPGDPPVLVADPSHAHRTLGWTPVNSRLETIIETAWNWYASRSVNGSGHAHGAGF